MSVKIKAAAVKKWISKNWKYLTGSSGVLAVALITYLAMTGAITITDNSGDMPCAGKPGDYCVATVTFTANKDIFIYPDQSWGLDTNQQLKNVKVFLLKDNTVATVKNAQQGNFIGLKEIDLNKICVGTWCGGKTEKAKNSFSLGLIKGKNYTLYYVAEKFSPDQTIKWGFGTPTNFVPDKYEKDYVDPFWYPEVNLSIVTLSWQNENHSVIVNESFWNSTCVFNETNSSWSGCTQWHDVTHLIIDRTWQELKINGNKADMGSWSVWCWEDSLIWCKSTLDGDGELKQPGVKEGMSYFWINATDSIVFYSDDYYGAYYLSKLQEMTADSGE
jgi:hypothetical protein